MILNFHGIGGWLSPLMLAVEMPDAGPEAWYDLAALKASLGNFSEALAVLKQALDLSALRLKGDPKARDLLAAASKDPRFDRLRPSHNLGPFGSPGRCPIFLAYPTTVWLRARYRPRGVGSRFGAHAVRRGRRPWARPNCVDYTGG